MLRNAVLLFSTLWLTSCGLQSENKQLKSRVNELEAELEDTRIVSVKFSDQLDKVDMLIDSINKSEAYIAFNLEMGTPYQDHIDRLRGLSAFIEYTRQKILKVENQMIAQHTENKSLQRLISKMRKELAGKDLIIKKLKKQIAGYEAENKELVRMIDLQKKEIINIEQQLKLKIAALNRAELNIEMLKVEKSKIKADAFYEKAEATEQIAKMTKLAPEKKKEVFIEALNLYKMALEAGRQDAMKKIKVLEASL
ncbi:MAG: hypothetical protein AAGI07_01925 [Bacteroidota bacterium]